MNTDMKIKSKAVVLTNRQREVLRLAAEGWKQDAIAHALKISAKGVSFHMGQIYHRIGVRGLALGTQWAIKHGVARWVVGAALAMGLMGRMGLMGAELLWDASTECGVTNYVVYRMAAGTTNFVMFAQTTNTAVTVPNGCGDVYACRAQSAVLGEVARATNWVPMAPSNMKISVTVKLSN
jgi:DNA-binding CsgD family transcriptional regulator